MHNKQLVFGVKVSGGEKRLVIKNLNCAKTVDNVENTKLCVQTPQNPKQKVKK